jgi:hypothetical protein
LYFRYCYLAHPPLTFQLFAFAAVRPIFFADYATRYFFHFRLSSERQFSLRRQLFSLPLSCRLSLARDARSRAFTSAQSAARLPRMPKRAAKRAKQRQAYAMARTPAEQLRVMARHDVIAVCRHSIMPATMRASGGTDAQRECMRATIIISLLMLAFRWLIFSPPILPFHAAFSPAILRCRFRRLPRCCHYFSAAPLTPDSYDAAAVFR